MCLPLGILFVFNTHALKGDLARVYLSEALGSAFAGIMIYFLVIPVFSNWQASALLGGAIVLFIFFSLPRAGILPYFVLALLLLSGLGMMDFPTQRHYWSPYTLIASTDSRYGKLQLIQSQDLLLFLDGEQKVWYG